MEEMMRAAQRLRGQAEALWRRRPGRAIRIVAGRDDRAELVKALRLWELSPDNRRPFFLIEASFLDERRYFVAVAEQVAADYEAVRRGAAEEGVALAPFGEAPAIEGAQRAGWAVARAAALLGQVLDGIVLVLMPRVIGEHRAFRERIAPWAQEMASEAVRAGVIDAHGDGLSPVLGREAAVFELDRLRLAAEVEGLLAASEEGKGSAGGARGGDAGLRARLGAGIAAAARGDHAAAAAEFDAAAARRRRGGVGPVASLAAGGLWLGAGAYERAAQRFLAAVRQATVERRTALACQGWWALSACEQVRGRTEEARTYEAMAMGMRHCDSEHHHE